VGVAILLGNLSHDAFGHFISPRCCASPVFYRKGQKPIHRFHKLRRFDIEKSVKSAQSVDESREKRENKKTQSGSPQPPLCWASLIICTEGSRHFSILFVRMKRWCSISKSFK
jgi:hypothetical protein